MTDLTPHYGKCYTDIYIIWLLYTGIHNMAVIHRCTHNLTMKVRPAEMLLAAALLKARELTCKEVLIGPTSVAATDNRYHQI